MFLGVWLYIKTGLGYPLVPGDYIDIKILS